MSDIIIGKIHDFFPRDRVFSIKSKKQIKYYSYKKEHQSLFLEAMNYKTVFVKFDLSTKTKTVRHALVTNIDVLYFVTVATPKGTKVLYNDDDNKEGLKKILNAYRYKMFIDLELTMPAFGEKTKFNPEILQIGCVIVNEEDKIVNYYSNYVKTVHPISFRTYKFLSLENDAIEDAISYEEFYKDYDELIKIYNPIVYVWGQNDISSLSSSMKSHNMKVIKADYYDLAKMHVKFFHMKEQPGLFTALKVYKEIIATQVHHALTDAQATKEVYDGFKLVANGKLDINASDFNKKEVVPVEE